MDGAFVFIFGNLSAVITACDNSVVVSFCLDKPFDEPRKIIKAFRNVTLQIGFYTCVGRDGLERLKIDVPKEFRNFSIDRHRCIPNPEYIELLRYEGILQVGLAKSHQFTAKDGELFKFDQTDYDFSVKILENGEVSRILTRYIWNYAESYALTIVPEMGRIWKREKDRINDLYSRPDYCKTPKEDREFQYYEFDKPIIERFEACKAEYVANHEYQPLVRPESDLIPIVDVEWELLK